MNKGNYYQQSPVCKFSRGFRATSLYRYFSFGFFFLLLITVGSAQAQGKKSKKKKKKAKQGVVVSSSPQQSKAAIAKAESIFIEGIRLEQKGELDIAIRKFRAAEELSPKSAGIKLKISQVLYRQNDITEAQRSIEQAIILDPENPFLYQHAIDIYAKLQNADKIIPALKKLASITHNEAYEYSLAEIYLLNNEVKEAMQVYDGIEQKYGISRGLLERKMRLYLSLNKTEKALETSERLYKLEPQPNSNFYQYLSLMQRVGKAEEALQLALENQKHYKNEPQFVFHLAKLYQATGDTENHLNILKGVFGDSEYPFEEKRTVLSGILQKAYSADERKIGLKLAKEACDAHPDNASAQVFYADFAITNNEIAIARDYYMKALRIDGNRFDVWQQVLNIDWELEDMDSLVKHADLALEYFPAQPTFHLNKGTGLYILKKNEEAAEALEMGLPMATNNTMRNQFNAQLGDIYYNLEMYEMSFQAYENVLGNDNNNVHVLNNYSYFLSLQKKNLDLAKEMSSKLVLLSPENPTYLDTHGWVLYVKGEYEEAKVYLEKAAIASTDATILEHYGDILFKLGQIDEAQVQWQRALNAGSDSPEALKKKISEQKLID